jgi:hypothetical protein
MRGPPEDLLPKKQKQKEQQWPMSVMHVSIVELFIDDATVWNLVPIVSSAMLSVCFILRQKEAQNPDRKKRKISIKQSLHPTHQIRQRLDFHLLHPLQLLTKVISLDRVQIHTSLSRLFPSVESNHYHKHNHNSKSTPHHSFFSLNNSHTSISLPRFHHRESNQPTLLTPSILSLLHGVRYSLKWFQKTNYHLLHRVHTTSLSIHVQQHQHR